MKALHIVPKGPTRACLTHMDYLETGYGLALHSYPYSGAPLQTHIGIVVFCQLEVIITIIVYVLDIHFALTKVTEHRRSHRIRDLRFSFFDI